MRIVVGVVSFVTLAALIGCTSSSESGPQPSAVGKTPPVATSRSEDQASTGSPETTLKAVGPAGALTPENTKIEWTGTKQGGKHDGGFKKFSGSVKPADGDFTASIVTVEIDTDSIYSDTNKLTNHLKNQDFFDVKKFPTATFTSKSIQKNPMGDATHFIVGDLTLHGTTKSITIPVKVTETADALTLEGSFVMDRLEFGIPYSPQKVDKDVKVRISAAVARK